MYRRTSLDWPLSREEKKGRVLELLDRDARAADHLLRVALGDFPKGPTSKPTPTSPAPIRAIPTPQRVRRKSLGDRPGCSAGEEESNSKSSAGLFFTKVFGGDEVSDDEPRETMPEPVVSFRNAMASAAAAAFDALMGMAPAATDATLPSPEASKGSSDGHHPGRARQVEAKAWEPAEEPECSWQATPTRARSEGREPMRRALSAMRGSRSLSRGHRLRVSFADDDGGCSSPRGRSSGEPAPGHRSTRRNLSPLLDRASHAAASAAAEAVAEAAFTAAAVQQVAEAEADEEQEEEITMAHAAAIAQAAAARAAVEAMASAAAAPAAGRRRSDTRRSRLRGSLHGYAQGSPTATIGVEDAAHHLEGCERGGCMEQCMSPG
mmetsp:Transcript_120796/g.313645  ORF Transcript_120796/g.313645 Transcript_120796/m.313645 type:complete len:379 (-) Transcript_120796:126-1262(-)